MKPLLHWFIKKTASGLLSHVLEVSALAVTLFRLMGAGCLQVALVVYMLLFVSENRELFYKSHSDSKNIPKNFIFFLFPLLIYLQNKPIVAAATDATVREIHFCLCAMEVLRTNISLILLLNGQRCYTDQLNSALHQLACRQKITSRSTPSSVQAWNSKNRSIVSHLVWKQRWSAILLVFSHRTRKYGNRQYETACCHSRICSQI